ncbi:MAG: hypothetical protein IJU60_03745 [Acholeplasmatales bacterium]|nr:hypothetical protein [Acholeplasmatales bacterium]
MKIKRLLAVFLFVFCILFLGSCGGNGDISNKDIDSFSKDIKVFNPRFDDDKDVTFALSNFTSREHKNLLMLDYTIKITNENSNKVIINLSEAKAYGNDELLQEHVYDEYDFLDATVNKLFTDKSFTLAKDESKNFEFILPIPDGNIDSLIRVDFKLNNVTLSVSHHGASYKPDKFTYVHNPNLNSAVLADAEYDANAVFGYKPNLTGSLKQYATYDWTKEEDVLKYKQERIKYIEENDAAIKRKETELRAQGKSIEEIARACSTLRNQIRLDQYKDDPEGLAKLKARNLEKYGHEEGPLPDELYVKYNNSWETVLEKCYSPNKGMDACCGVYDMYYYLT